MPIFEPRRPETEEFLGHDAASRALSVTAVENAFVTKVYENIAWMYDFTFGPTLHAGRIQSIQRMGINAGLYPPDCVVTGIDLSEPMLEKARERVLRKGLSNIRLLAMDAADLKFPDSSFDIVYAPYVISVVPDPVAVVREMRRVCRPGGRLVILNHFRGTNRLGAWLDRVISPLTVHIGFKSDLDLPAFLAQAELKPVSIEKVNVPRIWSLITCIKD